MRATKTIAWIERQNRIVVSNPDNTIRCEVFKTVWEKFHKCTGEGAIIVESEEFIDGKEKGVQITYRAGSDTRGQVFLRDLTQLKGELPEWAECYPGWDSWRQGY